MTGSTDFQSFGEFYPYYLNEHANRTCRRLHAIGTSFVIVVFFLGTLTGNLTLLWLLPLIGYGFAWIGHFAFEKNRPATFKYPLYSLMGDFKMWWQIVSGKIVW